MGKFLPLKVQLCERALKAQRRVIKRYRPSLRFRIRWDHPNLPPAHWPEPSREWFVGLMDRQHEFNEARRLAQ